MILLAMALALSGAGLLRLTWEKTTLRDAGVKGGAWFLLILSLAVWIRALGCPQGVVCWMAVVPLSAWVLTAAAGKGKRAAAVVRPRPWKPFFPNDSGPVRLTRGFLAGPLAMLACGLAGTAVARRLPVPVADQLVTAMFVAPLLWALTSIWVLSARRTLIPFALLSVLCVFALFLLRSRQL